MERNTEPTAGLPRLDMAAMRGGDPLDDSEAEAGSFRSARTIGAGERPAEHIPFIGRNAVAAVADSYHHGAAFTARGQEDSRFAIELRIADQI